MKPKRIPVRAADGRYEIVCGAGVLRRGHAWLARFKPRTGCIVLSSPRVWRAVGSDVRRGFRLSKRDPVILFDDRESAKTMRTMEIVCRRLVRAGADRRALLIAVGGGVVGDVAGFVAASYLRGVSLVHVPTTLVAQVDSAIGGKTGVNLPEGKNLVGAFYAPRLVIADPRLLRTLPQREYRSGLAEVIKYGVIADKRLFAYLAANFRKLLKRDPATMEFVIRRSIAIKARVVSRDERESGLREILNYGHTFAHALETLTKYCLFRHGEAVAWGIMAAALLGHEAGITPADHAAQVIALVRRMGPLPTWPRFRPGDILRAMRADKKSRAGKLRFVLSSAIGEARSYDSIPEPLVARVLHYAPHLMERPAKIHV